MRLLEKYIGYEETINLMESVAGNIVFEQCASEPDIILKTRQKINEKLEQVVRKKV